jgi:hypothetical protein
LRPRAFWFEEGGLTALLVLLLAYHLGLPLVHGLEAGRLVTEAYFVLLAVSGVITVLKRPVFNAAVGVVAAAVLVATWSEFAFPGPSTVLATYVAEATLVSFLLAAVVSQVFQAGPVTAHRVRGAIVIYLLIGVLFGFLYMIVVMLQPEAIRYSSDLDVGSSEAIRSELNYFSFVTLASLGYGDITPVSPMARALATLEAVTGQLFIAITLARLVSSQLAGGADSRTPPAG